MKWIFNIAIVLLLTASCAVQAQSDLPLTNKAAKLAVEGDLVGARTVINRAIVTEEAQKAYTWYVHGFIHKEIFKKIENESVNSENRETAIASVLKAKQLDKAGKYRKDVNNALEYLAKSHYNHAVTMIESADPDWLLQAEGHFDDYAQLMKEIDPLADLTDQRVAFLKNLAQGYEHVFENEPGDESTILMAISYYKRALELDPQDYDANYNTAIDYYNQGVHRIKRINHKTEIIELLMIQEECIQLFKNSLPYMLKAYDQKPQRKETLIGLMAIYRALNEYELSEEYKTTYTDLVEKGVIKEGE